MTTTIGGTDYFLWDIRHVFKTRGDILMLDAGQAFVVGAYVYLPADSCKDETEDMVHCNLAVNQKTVLQPLFRFRRWEVQEKQVSSKDQPSIAELESGLPPL